jgi:hypothetical protein
MTDTYPPFRLDMGDHDHDSVADANGLSTFTPA